MGAFRPWAALAALALAACGGAQPPEAQPPPAAAKVTGPVLAFSYESLSGAPLSTDSLRGRISVIGFVTTYDIASQAQVRFLSTLLRNHAPRLNVALLVLEQPENKPMVDAFAASLGIDYPVALADAATIAGTGPFAGLHHVPSVIVLDRQGREAWRHIGLIDTSSLDQAVRAVEAAPR